MQAEVPPPEVRALDLAKRMIDAWNARDLDRFVAPLAEDAEWYDMGMAEPPARGRAAVREFAQAALEAFPDFRYDIEEPICTSPDGSRCAIVWRITATHERAMRPLGLSPTGRRASFEGVDVLDIRDGQVTRIRTLFDPLPVAEQLLGLPIRPVPGTWRATFFVAAQRLVAWIVRRRT